MKNENNCCWWGVGIGMVIGLVIGLIISFHSPQAITNTTINAQINLNSDGGILTINATFFNINTTMTRVSTSTWYSSYKINSATEELPNGTIITPATSYVQKQMQIDCLNGIYLGNSNYYSC